jgi:hypothetical protein
MNANGNHALEHCRNTAQILLAYDDVEILDSSELRG